MSTLLKAAVPAASIFFFAAPSQATPLNIRVFTGFTDAFAPSNWVNFSSNGTASFNGTASSATTLTLTKPVANGGAAQRQNNLDQALLDSYSPNGRPFYKGTYSFYWTWTYTNPSPGGTTAGKWGFGNYRNSEPLDPLQSDSLAANTLDSGTVVNQQVVAGDVFGFTNARFFSGGSGIATGTISNFTFTAEYQPVPGPLPIAGAMAGFAWSRKLRRRLKSAQATV